MVTVEQEREKKPLKGESIRSQSQEEGGKEAYREASGDTWLRKKEAGVSASGKENHRRYGKKERKLLLLPHSIPPPEKDDTTSGHAKGGVKPKGRKATKGGAETA